MRVVPFTITFTDPWDGLVERAPMGTFLHTRRFLTYHGDRFEDASLLLVDDSDSLRAVLPAAVDLADPKRVVSHPGATYGGLVHDGRVTGDRAVAALAAIREHYAARGFERLVYKPVPHIYHASPSADDVWALTELGASRTESDLSCAIDLAARRKPSERRRRSLRTAVRRGVAIGDETAAFAALWPVLEATLERRHGARPVHTLAEIEELHARFPDQILPLVARLDGEVVAGAVLFAMHATVHTQYLAASEAGAASSALDVLIEHGIELARSRGTRYFDFGISVGPGRRGLLPGLYRYKAEFGGGGVLYEHYEMSLV